MHNYYYIADNYDLFYAFHHTAHHSSLHVLLVEDLKIFDYLIILIVHIGHGGCNDNKHNFNVKYQFCFLKRKAKPF